MDLSVYTVRSRPLGKQTDIRTERSFICAERKGKRIKFQSSFCQFEIQRA
jgi:hypothetical protein